MGRQRQVSLLLGNRILVGFARLARMIRDEDREAEALRDARRLLELRINLERVNSRILEPTTASRSLHLSKIARYRRLVPELGQALRAGTDGLADE